MVKIRVEQFASGKQYAIHVDDMVLFQSYDTIVAAVIDGVTYIDVTKYSTTTSKWKNIFINHWGTAIKQNCFSNEELLEVIDNAIYNKV